MGYINFNKELMVLDEVPIFEGFDELFWYAD